MRYLITGHTGFKGSWLAMMLKAQGHDVVGISLHPKPNSLHAQANLHSIYSEEHFLDIRNHVEFKQAIKSVKADVAFHLAAQPLVRDSYLSPIETYGTNVLGTLHFLDGVTDSDFGASIVVTTDKVYKNKNLLRGYTELDELGGHDPYSASKAAADIATQSWIASYDCKNVSIARAGNVIGGGDWATDRLFPDLVQSFAQGVKAKIRYPDAIRPWQHVADCLNGYLTLSEAMLKKQVFGIWNFGPEIDVDTSVARVADLATNAWGSNAAWQVVDGPQLHEAGYLLLDSTKARRDLQWKDKWNLETSIAWTIDFYRKVSAGGDPRVLLEKQIEEFLAR